MYLHSLKLKNFKGFRGESKEVIFQGPNGNPGSGLNILVGENNAGKSTILSAICFLHDDNFLKKKDFTSIPVKKDHDHQVNISDEVECNQDDCIVIGEFAETSPEIMLRRLKDIIPRDSLGIIKELLTSNSHIRCRRLWDEDCRKRDLAFLNEGDSFDVEGRKIIELDAYIIRSFCIHTFGFDDKLINNEKYAYVFNKTGIRLLDDILWEAQESAEFRNLKNAINSVFGNPNSPLRREMSDVEASISSQFQTFFGAGKLHFEFAPPTMDQLLESLSIVIDFDCPLALSEHGQGAQRIAKLAILAAWASKEANFEYEHLKTPYTFLLDEPEICLHPRGQEKLLKALLEISRHHQVFVATHSPIFLHSPSIRNANLLLCRKEKDTIVVQPRAEFASTFKFSPTWGEISWFAYNMPTIEFHNELYSHLQDHCGETKIVAVDKLIKQSLIEMQKQPVPYTWTRPNQNGEKKEETNRTLSYCVRNAIHHPDNPFIEEGFVENHLEESIKEMLDVVKHLRSKEAPSA